MAGYRLPCATVLRNFSSHAAKARLAVSFLAYEFSFLEKIGVANVRDMSAFRIICFLCCDLSFEVITCSLLFFITVPFIC